MIISEWVAVGVFVMLSGQTVLDTNGPFKTEVECKKDLQKARAVFETREDAIRYFGLACVEVKVDDTSVKKSVPKANKT